MQTVFSASRTIARGLGVAKKDPAIVFYPLLLFLVLLVSIPALNIFLIGTIAKILSVPVLQDTISISTGLVYVLAILTGLMTVSALLLFMACIVSAATSAKLEGKQAPLISGWQQVDGKLGRIVRTGIVCFPLVLIPIAIIAQRNRLAKHPFAVLTSSITLGVGGLAPAILSSSGNIRETIRTTITTLDKSWKEGIIVKVYLYGFVIILAMLSFLPKLVEDYWLDDTTASTAGWLTTAFMLALTISALKIFSTIFITILYRSANKKPA